MIHTELHTHSKTKAEDQFSLRGTLASVLLLGLIIAASWVGVYYLFLNRF